MGCGWIDDTAYYWKWTAQTDGDYRFYLTGNSSVYLAISTSTDCNVTSQFMVECNYSGESPIMLSNVLAGETYLIQASSAQGELTLALRAEDILCGPSEFVDDGLEENDSLLNAVPIVEGTHANLAVRHGDPDFYQVLIPAGEELLVQASSCSADVKVTLYDFQKVPVDQVNGNPVAVYDPSASVPRRGFIGVEILDRPGFVNCSSYNLEVATSLVPQSIQSFCDPAAPNSTGSPTFLGITPSLNRFTEASLFAFACSGPAFQFGYLISGDQIQGMGMPMGSQQICVGGNLGRYNQSGTRLNSIGAFGPSGDWHPLVHPFPIRASHQFPCLYPDWGIRDSYALPSELPSGLGNVMGGQSWGFQLWHREPGGGSSTSNGVLVNW